MHHCMDPLRAKDNILAVDRLKVVLLDLQVKDNILAVDRLKVVLLDLQVKDNILAVERQKRTLVSVQDRTEDSQEALEILLDQKILQTLVPWQMQ